MQFTSPTAAQHLGHLGEWHPRPGLRPDLRRPAAARKLCGDSLARPEAVGRDPCLRSWAPPPSTTSATATCPADAYSPQVAPVVDASRYAVVQTPFVDKGAKTVAPRL
jgi:hypothetical protein